MAHLDVVRAGTVPYEVAWGWQRTLAERRADGDIGDVCLLLEHPSVYTAGRRTDVWERPTDGTPVIDVDRGGKITWHGPGQLVGYPIVSLEPVVDVVAYVRRLEDALIGVCAEFGVTGVRVEGRSGVWVTAAAGLGPRFAEERGAGAPRGESKVAAIGVRVARGVTMHGFALNCDADLSAFDRIVPCGIRDASVTSLSLLTGRQVTTDDVAPLAARELAKVLDREARESSLAALGIAELVDA
ncbi:MAG: lipoyl(octanoyl) transferase LipB [Mycobacteriales bacterium]